MTWILSLSYASAACGWIMAKCVRWDRLRPSSLPIRTRLSTAKSKPPDGHKIDMRMMDRRSQVDSRSWILWHLGTGEGSLNSPLRFVPFLRPMVWGDRRLGDVLGKPLDAGQ